MSDPRPKAKAQITDWPEGYVASCRESYDAENTGLSDARFLALLKKEHGDMRFGKFIDLDIQQGFYLHPGNGVIDMPQGSGSGFVIGALERPFVDIHHTGQAKWWAVKAQDRYVKDGEAKLTWVLANAQGPWLLTADYNQGMSDGWYWLVLRFLSDADEAAYLTAFRKEGE